ncbi:18525_t:CDS:2, partial [Funneliformis geosporum]
MTYNSELTFRLVDLPNVRGKLNTVEIKNNKVMKVKDRNFKGEEFDHN